MTCGGHDYESDGNPSGYVCILFQENLTEDAMTLCHTEEFYSPGYKFTELDSQPLSRLLSTAHIRRFPQIIKYGSEYCYIIYLNVLLFL